MQSLLRNSKGSILLNSMIVAALVAGVISLIMTQTKETTHSSRAPRIKSAMTVMETQILSMALQPSLYQGCSAQATNCQLNSAAATAFTHFSRKIPGAQCKGSYPGGQTPGGSSSSAAAGCGVQLQAPSATACLNTNNPGYNFNCSAGKFYNPATQTFCAEIVYQGTEVPMQPVCASTTVPQSVLQGDSTACISPADLSGPYPKVVFKGYDAAGNAVCGGIPACSGGNVSIPGNYLTSIDKITLQTQCHSLSPGTLACPAGTVMANLQWMNVSSAFGPISPLANCVPRRSPADNHQIQAITSITVPPGTYTVNPPPTPTTLPAGPPGPPPTLKKVALICCSDGVTGYVPNPGGPGYASGAIVPNCGGVPNCACDSSFTCCVRTNGRVVVSIPANCY